MKAEYNFSKGVRGKFYDADAVFSIPIYLDQDVDDFMRKLAEEKNKDLEKLANEWLRSNILFIRSVQ